MAEGGYIVQAIASSRAGFGGPTVCFYLVAEPNKKCAERIVRGRMTADEKVGAVAPAPAEKVASLALNPGEFAPWRGVANLPSRRCSTAARIERKRSPAPSTRARSPRKPRSRSSGRASR